MFQTDISCQPMLFCNSYKDLLVNDSDVFLYEDIFSQLDLEDWDYAYGVEGHAKPPSLMLRTLFYGLTHGVVSGRKLEEVCRNDLRYIYLSGGLRPDRRTFDRFLIRHEERFNALFVSVIRLADKMGLVNLGRIAIDGTRIKGYTSKDGLSFLKMNETIAKLESQLAELKQVIKKENALEPGSDDKLKEDFSDKEKRLEKIKRAKEQLEKEHEQNPTRRTKKGGIPNDEAMKSLNDPEALSLSHKRREFIFGFNMQAAVEQKNQIVVAADLHHSATEYEAFVPLLEQVKENLRAAPSEVLADTGYYSADNIVKATAMGVTPFIAPKQEIAMHRNRVEQAPDQQILEQIKLNSDGRYKCLAGKVLPENGRRNQQIEFRPKRPNFCENCSLASQCIIKDKGYFNIPEDKAAQEAFLAHKKREATREFREVYKKRLAIIEPVFGNIKWNKMMRLFYKGKKNARRQFLIWCSAHNIEKLVKNLTNTDTLKLQTN